MPKKIESIEDLTPDGVNANNGTPRGQAMLEKSLETLGAGRSILADKNGVVIAGNKTLEAAAEKGFKIKTVQTTGDELVVVQRIDLDMDDSRARALAVADNRVAEVNLDWDGQTVAALGEMQLDGKSILDPFFFPDELEEITGKPGGGPAILGDAKPETEAVTLFLEKDALAEFNHMVAVLVRKYQTPKRTEIVMKALREVVGENPA